MKRLACLALMGFFVTLTGCMKDRNLLPPADGAIFTLAAKNADGLKILPAQVLYRSNVCVSNSSVGAWKKRELALEINPQSGLYEVDIPVDGGGDCEWSLSSVLFKVDYSNPEAFGEGLSKGELGDFYFEFPPFRKAIFFAEAPERKTMTIRRNYYPWIDWSGFFIRRKTLSLLAEREFGDGYYVPNQKVIIEPFLHSTFMLRSLDGKVNNRAGLYRYPDGKKQRDWSPSFSRLEEIRLAAELNQ